MKKKLLLLLIIVAIFLIGFNQLLNQNDVQRKVNNVEIENKESDELSGKSEVDSEEIIIKAKSFSEYLTEPERNQLVNSFAKVTVEEKEQIKKKLLLDSLLISSLGHQSYSIFKNNNPEKIERTTGLSGFGLEVTSHENNGEEIEIIKIDDTQPLQLLSSLYEINNSIKISKFRLYDKEKEIYYEPDKELSSLLTSQDGKGLITYQVPKGINPSDLYEEIEVDGITYIGEYFKDDKFAKKETE